MKPLTRILLAVRSFIDTLITKTSKPQPFYPLSYLVAPLTTAQCLASTQYGIYFNGSTDASGNIFTCTIDGTATGTNLDH